MSRRKLGQVRFDGEMAKSVRCGARLYRLVACAVFTGMLAELVATHVAFAQGEKAVMSDSVVNMIGVNTHFNFWGSRYDTMYSVVKSRLIESGIRHIRDNPGADSRYVELYNKGIKLLLINLNQTNFGYDYVKSLNRYGHVVEAVEPPNEKDGQWSMLCAFQRTMWNKYRRDPSMTNISILGPSFANGFRGPEFASACPSVSSYMNAGNTHNYSGSAPESPTGGGYGKNLRANLAATKTYAGNNPAWSTENGYTMDANPYTSSSELGAAKYLPRQFLTHLALGAPRLYIYQLINDYDDKNFGLLNSDGSPRLQFTAVKSFIKILEDPGPKFTTGSLNFTLSGDHARIRYLLLQKRNGTFYLAIWQAVSVTSPAQGGVNDVNNPTRSLTLTLASPAQTVRMYRPSTSGTKVITTLSNIVHIPLSIPDHVLVVEFKQ